MTDSQAAAQSAPQARDNAPLLTGFGETINWGDPVPGTGAGACGGGAGAVGRFRSKRPAVRLRPPRRGDHVPGHVDGSASTFHPADRVGGNHGQTGWRQCLDRSEHALVHRRPGRVDAGRSGDATRLGAPHGRTAGRTLRDADAALDGGRHDDLPELDHGRPGAQEGRNALSAPGGGTRVGSGLPTFR